MQNYRNSAGAHIPKREYKYHYVANPSAVRTGELYLRMAISFALKDINNAATRFLESVPQARVFAISGEMGAGKTTFISALCRTLGAKGALGSPTFSIINEYPIPSGRIFHMDLYRLKSEQEAMQAGVEDALYSGAYCFVEWPEKAPDIFPDETMDVQITVMPDHLRLLTFHPRKKN